MSVSPLPSAVPAAITVQDERFMRLALSLGNRHLGLTWPNPSVGAVVVDGRGGAARIVGQGITQAGGRPHAERLALEQAGEAARGATLYVTLEPCSARSDSNYGPSCTDLIVASGLRRLVIGAPDPSPSLTARASPAFRRRESRSFTACWPTRPAAPTAAMCCA